MSYPARAEGLVYAITLRFIWYSKDVTENWQVWWYPKILLGLSRQVLFWLRHQNTMLDPRISIWWKVCGQHNWLLCVYIYIYWNLGTGFLMQHKIWSILSKKIKIKRFSFPIDYSNDLMVHCKVIYCPDSEDSQWRIPFEFYQIQRTFLHEIPFLLRCWRFPGSKYAILSIESLYWSNFLLPVIILIKRNFLFVENEEKKLTFISVSSGGLHFFSF